MPSLEEVIPAQLSSITPGLRSVQVTPESVEVHMFPSQATAASLVPSLEDVMLAQFFVLPPGLRSVQVEFTGVSTLSVNRVMSRNLNTLRRGIVVDRRFVRSNDLENLADPELSQRRYVVLEGDKSWYCVQHYHQL